MLHPMNASESAPGLRERQKAARRDALVAAAQVLVGENGLDGVTVDDICERAGVSTRTFFNYFESKDDAVLALGPWTADADAVESFASGGPTGVLLDDVEHLVAALVDRPAVGRERMTRAMELARTDHRLLERQVAAFARHHGEVAALVARRLGVDQSHPDADLVTHLVLSLAHTAMVRWDAQGGAGQVREVVPETVERLRALLA